MEEPGARGCGTESTSSIPDVIYGFRGEGEPLRPIEAALRAGASVDGPCAISGRTPLMLCSQKGWLGCARLLMDAGADPRARDPYGRDALMLALIARQEDSAKALAGVSDLGAFDADGRCPLALAALHLPHKADLDLLFSLWRPGLEFADDHQGFNALDWAKGNGMAALNEFRGLLRALAEAADLAGSCAARSRSRGAAWI